jgi:hypothetical protein
MRRNRRNQGTREDDRKATTKLPHRIPQAVSITPITFRGGLLPAPS